MATTRVLVMKGGYNRPPDLQLNPDKARTAMVVVSRGFLGTHVKSR